METQNARKKKDKLDFNFYLLNFAHQTFISTTNYSEAPSLTWAVSCQLNLHHLPRHPDWKLFQPKLFECLTGACQ